MALDISEKLTTFNINDDSDTSKLKPTKTLNCKAKTPANSSLEKSTALIESRGVARRHGACSWYNAELVMLGMAIVLFGNGKDVAAYANPLPSFTPVSSPQSPAPAPCPFASKKPCVPPSLALLVMCGGW